MAGAQQATNSVGGKRERALSDNVDNGGGGGGKRPTLRNARAGGGSGGSAAAANAFVGHLAASMGIGMDTPTSTSGDGGDTPGGELSKKDAKKAKKKQMKKAVELDQMRQILDKTIAMTWPDWYRYREWRQR
jgi:hypothetical protein